MMRRVVRAFGMVVAIHSDAPDLFVLLDHRLPVFPEARETPEADITYHVHVLAGRGVAVRRDRRTIATVPDVPAASERLVADLQAALARRAPGWIFVHAGVVAIEGGALLLPARSYAGKTTLVAALLRAGADYGSDEFAVVDPAGSVHPYSRALAVRLEAAVAHVDAETLGGMKVTAPLRVRAVLFTHYQPGAALALCPLSGGQMVLQLMQHCLGVRGRPAETMAALHSLARDARGFAGARGEADVTALALVQHMRGAWRAETTAP